MNMRQIEDAIQESVREESEEILSAIQYNLNQVFSDLLYSIKMESDKRGGVGDIDNLISHVVRTSRRETGDYPVWDEKDEKIQKILARLRAVLESHGVDSHTKRLGKNRKAGETA